MFKFSIIIGLFIVSALECQAASLRPRRLTRAISDRPLLVGYWGQNGAGPRFGPANYERNLEWFCENSKYDIINVAFVVTLFDSRNKDSLPGLNFAYHCSRPVAPGHVSLFRCLNIEKGIRACQRRNKKVLMSVGGSTMYADLGSSENARQHARHLWHLFLGGKQMMARRPFGTAVMDGIDLNLEAGKPNYFPDVVRELRLLMATDSSKSYLITSAPQCPHPDRMLGPVTPGTVLADVGKLTDYVFIQYYNNFCWTGSGNSFNTNLETWLTFSRQTNVGVMIGLPAHTGASGQARYHRTVDAVKKLWDTVKARNGVSGIMLWDLSWDQNNVIENRIYSDHIYDIMNPPTQSPPTSTTVTQSPPSSTTVAQSPPQTTTTTHPPPQTNATTQSPPQTNATTQTPPQMNGTTPILPKTNATTQYPSPTATTTQSTTTTSSVPANFCIGKQDIHHSHPSDCTKFVMCANSLPVIMSCPKGLLYDSRIMVCNWPSAVKCNTQ